MAERRRLGQYILDRKIGAGGMAEVFLARRLGEGGFERSVAVKTIVGAGTERDSVRLFLDEARAAALLEHSAIVRTIDLGYDDDTLYIVMEYVDGPSLARLLKELRVRKRGMGAMQVAHVGARIAEALDYAHRRATANDGSPLRLIHRDVSPHNIMITRQGVPKLTDFGIATSAIQHHVTKTGMIRGKAAYMAPEQVSAKPLDGRADMFSLALVLYESLSQRRPYERESDLASMKAILAEDIPAIENVNKSVPPALAAVIGKALMKKPNDRFENAEEMAAALRDVLKGHSASDLELGWAKVLDAFFGKGTTDPEDGHPIQSWHPTVALHSPERAKPSVPSNPSQLKDILSELADSTPSSASQKASVAPERATPSGPAPPEALTPAVEAAFAQPISASAPLIVSASASRSGSGSNLIGLGILLALGAALAGIVYMATGGAPAPAPERPAIEPIEPGVSAIDPKSQADPNEREPAAVEPPPTPPRTPVEPPPPPPRSPAHPPPPAKSKAPDPPPPATPHPVASKELAPIAALLARAQRDEASPREIVELGDAIMRASSKVEDSALRTRIQRVAKASANLGDVAGLARAFADLRQGLER